MNAFWGSYEKTIQSWFEKVERQDVVRRIWSRDVSLWTKDPAGQKEAASRLGWLTAPAEMKEKTSEWEAFAAEVRQAGFTKILLLGMGGSSLAPEVFQKVFGNKKGYPELLVLDSTDPARVKDIEAQLDLERTLFIVSSKSGGTLEPVSFFKYFFGKIKTVKKDPAEEPATAGRQFIAITDPGSPLEALAEKNGFRKVFLAPADIGGRFSALTVFGLVPAALIGVDVGEVLNRASQMAEKASVDFDIEENPAVPLGIGMAVLAEEGKDKLTIVTADGLGSFADWAEQLVAESSGKEESGIVPVTHEPLDRPGVYGRDRFFTMLSSESQEDPACSKKRQALRDAGHPVLELTLKDPYDLGGEFFRWEFATALACALLKVNAFDQPDVQSAKDSAKEILRKRESGEDASLPRPETDLGVFWEDLEENVYIGILAFLPDRSEIRKELESLRAGLRELTGGCAVTLGFGPRYLHSTGQLHKGGPNSGVFILITARHAEDVAIPGESYGFRTLERAQAIGDLEALRSKGRRVLHFELEDLSDESLKGLSASITGSVRSRD